MNNCKGKKRNFRSARIEEGLKLCIFLSLILLSCFSCAAVSADELEDRVREISHKLRCPTCQAMSVKESDAGLSTNMRNKVRDLIQEGKSEQEILDYFEDRYGEWVLRSPKKEGFNLVLWLTPLLLIIVIGFITVRVLWKRSRQQDLIPSTPPLTEKEKSQLDNDLNRFRTD